MGKTKDVSRPETVRRGKLEYRMYAQKDLDQIRMFMQSRMPNSNVQIIGNISDGVRIFGAKLRGPSDANIKPPQTQSTLPLVRSTLLSMKHWEQHALPLYG